MKEFALGGDNAEVPEVIGDCAEAESSDSSTVGSKVGLSGIKGLNPLLLELLGTASKD